MKVIVHDLTEEERAQRSLRYSVEFDVWNEMSKAFNIPRHMLHFDVAGGNERDVRKYINTVNATMKGSKRRARRMRAFISKMARKK